MIEDKRKFVHSAQVKICSREYIGGTNNISRAYTGVQARNFLLAKISTY